MAGSSWTNQVVTTVIIAGTNGQLLVYDQIPPSAGHLLASIVASSGTDTPGNATLGSLAAYSTSGSPSQATRITGAGGVAFYTAASEAGPWAVQGSVFWDTINTALEISAGGAAIPVEIFGKLTGVGVLPLVTGTQNIDGTAYLQAEATPSTLAGFAGLFATSNSTPAAILPSGLTGTLPVTQSDISTTTNANAVGVQPISKQWTIPANDAQVGTKYEIILPWQATMEATNTLQLGTGLNGAVMTNAVTISAAIVGAGVGIRGTIRGWLKVKTTGTLGTADFFFDGTVQQTGASVTFANSGSIPTQPALAVAFNTTVANTLQVNSQWGGSTAGQTVSGYDSDFIRSGP